MRILTSRRVRGGLATLGAFILSGGACERAVANGGTPDAHLAAHGAVATAPRHLPLRLQHTLPSSHRAAPRRASMAAWEPLGYVDTTAFCHGSSGDFSLNPDGSAAPMPSLNAASSGQPNLVRPTVAGYQWVAFRLSTVWSNGTIVPSDWYYGALYPSGNFYTFYDNATATTWKFQNVRTGEHLPSFSSGLTPAVGYGVRFNMDVVWYVGNAITRSESFGVPWYDSSTGAYCRN